MQFGDIDRFWLLGGGALLRSTAARLKASGHPVFVATSMRQLTEEAVGGLPLDRYCADLGAPCVVTDDIATSVEVHSQITPSTMGLSFGAPWLFKEDVITRFGGRLLNLHGARLPHYRGGGGFSWQILCDNRQGYALIHLITAGIDDGPIVVVREFRYPSSCRVPQDYQQVLLHEYDRLLDDFFPALAEHREFATAAQPEYLSQYWPRLATGDQGLVDWRWSATEIERFICAFDEPYAGASTFLSGSKVFLKTCSADFADGTFHPFQRGLVYRKTAAGIYVAAGTGALHVGRVDDENGNSVLPRIRVGMRFHTPSEALDRAMAFRAVYTPRGLRS